MPDVLVGEKTCDRCGAEVREDTQFCYNCGSPVAPEAIPQPGSSGVKIAKPTEMFSEKDPASPSLGVNGELSQPLPSSEPVLRSAASLRRKGKPPERKYVEVVWVPAGDRTNWVLVLSTIFFLIFTVIVVIEALYYR